MTAYARGTCALALLAVGLRAVTSDESQCADLATLASGQLNPSGVMAESSGIYWMVLWTAAQNFTDGALRRTSSP